MYLTSTLLVDGILDDEDHPGASLAREMILKLAHYARELETRLHVSQAQVKAAATMAKPVKTEEQISTEVDRLVRTVSSGISKQMSWKPSCKTKFAYDGVCPDPLVFGAMLGLEGAPTFKAKKIAVPEFEELMGDSVTKSVRYDVLCIRGDNVNAR